MFLILDRLFAITHFDASFNELLATREGAYAQMLNEAIELKLARLHEVEKRYTKHRQSYLHLCAN